MCTDVGVVLIHPIRSSLYNYYSVSSCILLNYCKHVFLSPEIDASIVEGAKCYLIVCIVLHLTDSN